ncbi:MAG: hypothetical protein HZA54_04940 [Planctomycetes bacterium]|nr:hypothetical protein [Planctomycetota bacterium]
MTPTTPVSPLSPSTPMQPTNAAAAEALAPATPAPPPPAPVAPPAPVETAVPIAEVDALAGGFEEVPVVVPVVEATPGLPEDLMSAPCMHPYFDWPAIPAPPPTPRPGERLRAIPISWTRDDTLVAQRAMKEEIQREWERLYQSGATLSAIRIGK